MEIIAAGFSNGMTGLVMNALKKGERPPELAEEETPVEKPDDPEDGEAKEPGGNGKKEAKEKDTSGKPRDLISGSVPKSSPIRFAFAQKEILLDPLELHTQYRYYLDLSKRNGGITETFSEVLTLAMQVLWFLHQDIPVTENMLKAVFSK